MKVKIKKNKFKARGYRYASQIIDRYYLKAYTRLAREDYTREETSGSSSSQHQHQHQQQQQQQHQGLKVQQVKKTTHIGVPNRDRLN